MNTPSLPEKTKRRVRIFAVVLGAVVVPFVLFVASNPLGIALFFNAFPHKGIEIEGNSLILSGSIKTTTYPRVVSALDAHPEVSRVVLVDIPGSIDDAISLMLGREIRERGLETHLPEGSEIASGGVHIFLAGVKRSMESGAEIGVHAWQATDGTRANMLHQKHPEHFEYIAYYEEIGIGADFYWFFISSAPPNDMYWLTKEDIERFGLITEEVGAR